jgi:hypothetical protein
VLDRATRLARAAAIIPAPVQSAPAKARPADRSGIATFLSRFFNAPWRSLSATP